MFKLTLLRQCVQSVAKQSNNLKLNPIYLSTSAARCYDKDVVTRSFETYEKKYFFDLKQKDSGERYIKLSELFKGKRFSLMMNSDVVDQLMNELEKEGEVGQSLECTSKDGKTYSIDRSSNDRGEFVTIKEQMIDGGKRFQIIVPSDKLTNLVDIYKSDMKQHLSKKDNTE